MLTLFAPRQERSAVSMLRCSLNAEMNGFLRFSAIAGHNRPNTKPLSVKENKRRGGF
jgi:hypothetical protein